MDKFLYPRHPVRCNITGPSECGNSCFLTNLTLYLFNEKKSPSFHQDKYQELNKHFGNYMPIHIIPNILNEKSKDLVIQDVVNDRDFEKLDTRIET